MIEPTGVICRLIGQQNRHRTSRPDAGQNPHECAEKDPQKAEEEVHRKHRHLEAV